MMVSNVLTSPSRKFMRFFQILVHACPPLTSPHLAFLISAPFSNAKALLMGVCKASMFLKLAVPASWIRGLTDPRLRAL